MIRSRTCIGIGLVCALLLPACVVPASAASLDGLVDFEFGEPSTLDLTAIIDDVAITNATSIVFTNSSGSGQSGDREEPGWSTMSGDNVVQMELNPSGGGVGFAQFTVTAGGSGAIINEVRFYGANNGGVERPYSIYTSSDNFASAIATNVTGGRYTMTRAVFADINLAADTPLTFRVSINEADNSATRFDDIQLHGRVGGAAAPQPVMDTEIPLLDFEFDGQVGGPYTHVTWVTNWVVCSLMTAYSEEHGAELLQTVSDSNFDAAGTSGDPRVKTGYDDTAGDGTNHWGYITFWIQNASPQYLDLTELQFLLGHHSGAAARPYKILTSQDSYASSIDEGNSGGGSAFTVVDLSSLNSLAPLETITLRVKSQEDNNAENRHDDVQVFGKFVTGTTPGTIFLIK